MWISAQNGRKSKKEASLDKIKQYIKMTEKSSYSGLKIHPLNPNLSSWKSRKHPMSPRRRRDSKCTTCKSRKNFLPGMNPPSWRNSEVVDCLKHLNLWNFFEFFMFFPSFSRTISWWVSFFRLAKVSWEWLMDCHFFWKLWLPKKHKLSC